MERVKLALMLNWVQVTAKFAVLNAPPVTLRLLPQVKALPSIQPPPTLPSLNVTAPAIETPFVVTVLPVDVELNVIAPVLLHTVPANSVMEPRTFNVGDVPVANVTVPADTVMSRQFKAPVMVTV